MENQQADIPFSTLMSIAVSTSLLKVFSVLYFLFLPILYALNMISAASLGYIGALLILGILFGALLLAYKPHSFSRPQLLAASGVFLMSGTLFLFLKEQLMLLALAYLLIGLAIGIGITIMNELAAQLTSKNNRFAIFANISMVWDILRIGYTLVVGMLYLTAGFTGLVWFAMANVLVLICLFYRFTVQYNPHAQMAHTEHLSNPFVFLKQHKSFAFVTGIEFLDSFASSQLFVFCRYCCCPKNFLFPMF
jgi:MFS family permease